MVFEQSGDLRAATGTVAGPVTPLVPSLATAAYPGTGRVAIDPAGNAIWAWERDLADRYLVEVRDKPAGQGLKPTVTVTPDVANARAEGPAIAIGADGRAMVAYGYRVEMEPEGVRYNTRSAPAGDWGSGAWNPTSGLVSKPGQTTASYGTLIGILPDNTDDRQLRRGRQRRLGGVADLGPAVLRASGADRRGRRRVQPGARGVGRRQRGRGLPGRADAAGREEGTGRRAVRGDQGGRRRHRRARLHERQLHQRHAGGGRRARQRDRRVLDRALPDRVHQLRGPHPDGAPRRRIPAHRRRDDSLRGRRRGPAHLQGAGAGRRLRLHHELVVRGRPERATGTDVTHAFAGPGAYAVTVTATDAVGNASSRSGTVQVRARARAGHGRRRGRVAVQPGLQRQQPGHPARRRRRPGQRGRRGLLGRGLPHDARHDRAQPLGRQEALRQGPRDDGAEGAQGGHRRG